MSNLIVRESSRAMSALGSGPSLLGEMPARIPIDGQMRPGIKVLTPKASANQLAVKIYNDMFDRDAAFSDIERRIVDECKISSPLMPRNMPYFRASGFSMPEIAKQILDMYGEDRGQGKKVYRFPILFPMDSWQAVMPHRFASYTYNEMMYWSEYGDDGNRYCKMRVKPEPDPRTRRIPRLWGGRPVVSRPDNGGLCDPSKCREYQSGLCNLTGKLIFYIPGVPGVSAIELPFRSINSMLQIRSKLEMVSYLRGGQISGLIDGKPLFYVVKRQRQVSMLDPETGKAKRVSQWLVEIEADIDMSQIFASKYRGLAVPSESTESPISYLEMPAANDGELDSVQTALEVSVDAGADHCVIHAEAAQDSVSLDTAAAADVEHNNVTISALSEEEKKAVSALRKEVNGILIKYSIPLDTFTVYASAKWGESWGKARGTLLAAKAELESEAAADVTAYIDKLIWPC